MNTQLPRFSIEEYYCRKMNVPYGHHKDALDSVYSSLPHREKQISTLTSLFGERSHPTYPSIFVYGHTATGKTAVVTKLLKNLQLPHALVNCCECYSQRILYELVLNQLSGHVPSPTNNYTSYVRCDNMNDFVRFLKSLLEEKELTDETVYIVLDKAEKLRSMEKHILPAFLKLNELCDANLCVVLISEIVWDNFRTTSGLSQPFPFYFPDYTKSELIEIISRECPEGFSTEFYSAYVNILMNVFYMACRSLNEIRYLAKLNFKKYIEPIEKGTASCSDAHKLWKNIEPHLKQAMSTIYLREVSSSQWEKYQKEASALPKTLSSTHAQMELPYYSKFLLIAAYLASYNPARTDKRFFSKTGTKEKKSKALRKPEKISYQLAGPRPFPLDRLMAIFYSVVDDRVAPSASIFSQISTLVTLKLLSPVGQLDVPKYKCTVSLNFIRSIARTVNFDVVPHLYDFL